MPAEHPRPDRRRDGDWWSLDGPWTFIPDDDPAHAYDIATLPADGATIQVPFAWETTASGIGRHWLERAWYRRRVARPDLTGTHRLILHVGAAHEHATVYVDGHRVAEHHGGQTAFEVDLTAATEATGGDDDHELDLVIRVEAPIDQRDLPHGKQRSIPADPYDVCSFTPCRGIWQSVWLEIRPATWITDVALTPTAALDGFDVVVRTAGRSAVVSLVASVEDDAAEPIELTDGRGRLRLATPRIWSPQTPELTVVVITLTAADGGTDTLRCTTGLRTIEAVDGELRLNGERVYLRGVLDQGYWPDSGWTAPDHAALVADLEHARSAGFTLVRKHLKLEDPRWLHHADRTGMLVWAEPPGPGRFSAAGRAGFDDLVEAMIIRDRQHPSIVVWGLYNEEWGLDWDVAGDPVKQDVLAQTYDLARRLDPTRPVVDNSGWSHVRTDVADWHVYTHDLATWRDQLDDLSGRAHAGFRVDLGVGGVVTKQVMADGSDPGGLVRMNSEYGTGTTSVERAWAMRWQTQELRRLDDLSGYVYTELYDIEHELAGVLDAWRNAKDDFGLVPADTHADTVLVVDVVPHAPGTDLVVGAEGLVELGIRVSHHGSDPVTGRVSAAWTTVGAAPPANPAAESTTETSADQQVTAKPYRLSEPVPWRGHLPAGRSAARLSIRFTDETGAVRARAGVDVRRAPDGTESGRSRPLE